MARAYNFSAGPATLPEPVLRQAQEEMLDWHGAGASIVELSHRSSEFIGVAARAEADLRALLSVPQDYAVLFLAGGATTQQALLPLNFAAPGQVVDHVVTGHWGRTALKQAQPYVRVQLAADGGAGGYRDIPARQDWSLSADAAYVHITANETIHGVQFQDTPEVGAVPLFADFSSSIASEPLDLSRYALVYAGAQKNLGPVGISVVMTMLSRAMQVNHAEIGARIPAFGAETTLLPAAMNPSTATGLALLNAEVNRQAAAIGYLNDFKLMMLLTLVSMPLVLLMRGGKASSGGNAGADAAAAH